MIKKDQGYRLFELDAEFHDFNGTQITLIIMIRKDQEYQLKVKHLDAESSSA